jgi:hypothetical protein
LPLSARNAKWNTKHDVIITNVSLGEEMKIYKYKDFSDKAKHEEFYQIVLHNLFWCANPDSLNDEDEFDFKPDCEQSSETLNLLKQIVAKFGTTNHLPPELSVPLALNKNKLKEICEPIFDDMKKKCRKELGVTSFSALKNDKKLWNEYGGKGNGACIEIDIPDHLLNQSFHPVKYITKKIIHVDSIFKSALYQDQLINTYSMLLTKTKRWSYEEEIRFISNKQDESVKIDDINGITLGDAIPDKALKEIMSNIINHCNTNNTKISRL